MKQIEFPAGLDLALHDVKFKVNFTELCIRIYEKKRYEIENNSNFDLCIRFRWDTMFDEQVLRTQKRHSTSYTFRI